MPKLRDLVPWDNDPDESELRAAAERQGLTVNINRVSQVMGRPHVELHAKRDRKLLLAALVDCADAIEWLKGHNQ